MLYCVSAVQRLQSPAEIVWLNGAPGSGKGTNTPFILESRGLSRAVTMCAAALALPARATVAVSQYTALQCHWLTSQLPRPFADGRLVQRQVSIHYALVRCGSTVNTAWSSLMRYHG